MGPDSFQWCPATGQGAMGTNWSTGSSIWTRGRTSSLWGWQSPGTDCPGRLWILLLWRYSRLSWTLSCAACCRWPFFGRGVGLDDPQRSIPTPAILWCCDSVIQIESVVCKMGRKLAKRLHSKGGDLSFLLRLAACQKWGPPGLNTRPRAVQHFHIFCGCCDWKHPRQVCWQHQTGSWGTHVRRETHLTESLDRLEEWTSKSSKNFSKAKCKFLHLEQNNWRAENRLLCIWLWSSFAERNVGVLVDNRLNISEHMLMKQQRQVRSWFATAGALPAEVAPWPSHSIQLLSGHTWSTVSSSGPQNLRKIRTEDDQNSA